MSYTALVAKREAKKVIKYPLSMEEPLYEQALAYATKNDMSLAQLIRRLLRAELTKDKPSA